MNDKTIEEKRVKYERAHDSVKAFMEEVVSEESTEENYITKLDFHITYVIYCGEYGLPREKYEGFYNLVKKNRSGHVNNGMTIRDGRKDVREKNAEGKPKLTYCWLGVKFTNFA